MTTRFSSLVALFVTLACLGLGGCAAEGGEPDADESADAEESSEAPTTPPASTTDGGRALRPQGISAGW